MNEFDDDILYKAGFSWRDLHGEDRWEAFVPVFGALTVVGATSYSGRVRTVGRQVFFQVQFSAATSIASVAGTDYLTLPITAKSQSLAGIATMQNLTTNVAVGVCVINVSTSRCYLPTQVASGSIFLLCGSYEI